MKKQETKSRTMEGVSGGRSSYRNRRVTVRLTEGELELVMRLAKRGNVVHGGGCTMSDDRRIIWSNFYLDYDDWKDDLEADYPDLSEQERIALMYEINGDYLDDERMNLNVQLSAPILVIGDLGLWNGRRMGYKEIASGKISDCLYSDTDYATWYVDRLGDLRCDAIHHDGTNHYLYRTYKPGVRQSQIDHLKEKLYFGTATRADITRITRRLGDDIAKVYGFSIPRQRQEQAAER